MMNWQAIILAGSRGSADPVAMAAGVSHKAFVTIAGQTMISHVINALKDVGDIDQIAVSIEADAPALPGDLLRLNAASSPSLSVLAAADALQTPLLITTADNPFLKRETLTTFLETAVKSDADIIAAVSSKNVVEKAGRAGKRTYLKFSDHHVSGCNLFAIRTSDGLKAVHFWRKLEKDRKKPWKMALEIGPFILLQYLLGWLHSGTALKHLGRRMKCKTAFVFLDDPLAAHDVDKPEDLAFAEECFQSTKRDT